MSYIIYIYIHELLLTMKIVNIDGENLHIF